MDALRTFAIWVVAILVALELSSFYLGVPHDTLLQAMSRNANNAGSGIGRHTDGPVPYCPQNGRMVRCD